MYEERRKKGKNQEPETQTKCVWMPVGAVCLVPPSSPCFFFYIFYFIYTMKHFKSKVCPLLYCLWICAAGVVKSREDMNKSLKVFILYAMMYLFVYCVWMILNATVYYCWSLFSWVYYIRWGFVRYLIVCYRFIILGFVLFYVGIT